MSSNPDLDRLISQVELRASDAGALGKLETAVTVAEVVADQADQLIHYFVHQARDDGRSWTQVGGVLGVSKQAARQRFGDRQIMQLGDLAPTVRLQACLQAATVEAEQDGVEVSTDHQLIGLFEQGVAAAMLDRLGVAQTEVRTAARDIRGSSDANEAAAALDRAVWLARRAGHDYVGTEHLLAALVLDPGSRARRILQALDFDFARVKRELAPCLEQKRATRRRRRTETQTACSFCGKKRREDVRLVAGPGVCICEECIGHASSVLSG